MQYESDIFISYAHADNRTSPGEEEGWISRFHRALEVRVGQLLDKDPSIIWRDPKLEGNEYLSDTLIEQLTRTAVLVSVLSPRYVSSEWCIRELKEFAKRSEQTGGVRIGNKSRIFKVVKTPVPLDQHPPPVRELLGYNFFKIDPETGREWELDLSRYPDAKRDFWTRLDDLALGIRDLLVGSARSAGRLTETGDGTELPRGVVYLADTGSDLTEERAAIRRDLEGHGYTVLPEQTVPLMAPELETLAREALARAQLSVHVIGRAYGVVPDGDTRSVGAIEHDLAVQRETAGDFTRLIWIPARLEAEDERQRTFIESLRTDRYLDRSADLLETSLEDLKTVIHEKLSRPDPSAGGTTGGAPESRVVRIYLIPDQRDGDATRPLADFLFEQGYEVILPVFEGDEAEVRADHEENLSICDGLIIYWGAGDYLWLRRKARELTKLPGYRRTTPPLSKAVYVASPTTGDKETYRTQEALLLRQANGFEPAILEPFLAEILASRTASGG